MSAKKTWLNCVLAVLTFQVIIGCGFLGLYFGVKVFELSQEVIQILLLALIIGFVIFSSCAIFAGKESLNKYYDCQKAHEEMKKEECKLSQHLLQLISKNCAMGSPLSKELLNKTEFSFKLLVNAIEDHA